MWSKSFLLYLVLKNNCNKMLKRTDFPSRSWCHHSHYTNIHLIPIDYKWCNCWHPISLFCYLLDFIGLFRLVYFIILFASYLLHKKLSKLFLLCIVSLCQLHYLFSILNLFMVPMFMIPSRVERWIMAGGEGVSNSERDGFPWGGADPLDTIIQ